jgi:aldehyde dehydrogenase
MIQANEHAIRTVVQEVLAQLGKRPLPRNGAPARSGDWGVFSTVDQAVDAASEAFEKLKRAPLADRAKAVQVVKDICERQADELGRMELDETKIGRLDHKIEKLKIIKLVPGVEWLRSDAVSGDHGLTVTEYAPFGVIGAITPVTHSLPTLAGNIVNMVAAGNTMVVNPHPSGRLIACEGVRRFNRAIYEATGLENLITIIEEPTLESAEAIFNHRGVRLLCVTGGPGVARAALASRKRAIVAGPGNPPVVVDETACLQTAAKAIVAGAAYDNNLLCIGEKEVFAVEKVFDDLMETMGRHGGYRLDARQVEELTAIAFEMVDHPGSDEERQHVGKHTGITPAKRGKKAMLNRDLIGKDASALAERIGLRVLPGTELLYGETDESNPFVPEEQMMPFVPFVRARNFEHAVEMAKRHEHGFGHTSLIHSRDVRNMTMMGRVMDTTLFIKNGPCMAGLGLGGEGYLSFSIATPTGEGVTNPLTFTRQRRCSMVDNLRII